MHTTYTARVSGRTRKELEQAALYEAAQFFGHDDLRLVSLSGCSAITADSGPLSDWALWRATCVISEQVADVA